MAARPRSDKRPTVRKGDIAADEAVYGAIRQALHLGRLVPGTKMQEPLLARVLGVSRERVRKSLHRLVHEGWLGSVPNRGTFVPAMSVAEMRGVYDVRSMLEVGIVRRLSDSRDTETARRLMAHLEAERRALETDDRSRLIDLSREFHVMLAELCQNTELTRLVSGFLARTTMRFALSAPQRFDNCAGPHDHRDIVEAILAGKAEQASALMLAHLDGLLTIQLARPLPAKAVGLAEAFHGIVPARRSRAMARQRDQ